jgi:hypothetical protein
VLAFLGIDHDVADFAEPARGNTRRCAVRSCATCSETASFRGPSRVIVPYNVRKSVRNAILVKAGTEAANWSEEREFLVRYYRDDVARLEVLLGRKLPWKNFGAPLTRNFAL